MAIGPVCCHYYYYYYSAITISYDEARCNCIICM